MYPATASGTQYRIGRPSRTLRRMSVADMSMAGTSTVPEMTGSAGTADPGLANTTIRASRATSSASRQSGRSAAASAPSNSVNSAPGSRAAELAQGVHRIRGSRPAQLQGLDRQPGHAGHRQAEHDGAIVGGRAMLPLLEGLLARGDESQAVESQRLRRHQCDDEMPVVNRVERPAQETDHPLRRPRPNRRDTPGRCRPSWDGSA